MDLEKMAVSLRPRSAWEAVDLGVAILRRFWVPVYMAWATCVAPVFALAFWGLEPVWACLLLWWLLPLFDRVPLYVISRALFGATPSLGQVARALPSLWSRHLFRSLVFGRPDPLRSFHLPVQQLEGQSLGRYTKRCAVLNHGNVGVSFLLTLSGWMLGTIVFFGLFVVVLLVIPEGWLTWPPEQLFDSPGMLALTASLLFVSVSLVEPMYVAAGFALYLNRRTELEGWDIELVFRRLRARLLARSERERERARQHQHQPVRVVGLLLVACLLGASLPAQPNKLPRPAGEIIQEVLEDRDFGYEEKVTGWRYIGSTDEPAVPGRTSSGVVAGEILRVLMWVGVAGVLGWLLYVMLTSRGPDSAAEATRAPDTVRGLDVRPESLPENVAEAAWQMFASGDAAGCLSLLYRGALAILIRDHDLTITESSTEGDCLRLVQAVADEAPERVGYFGALTSAWTSCAYAHREPAEAVARKLCDDWDRVFGGTS